MKSNVNANGARLIAEMQAAVLEQSKKNDFEPTPYERATKLLESLPSVEFVDDRVQLALDITLATRMDYRPDLSRRALYAAFPAGTEVKEVSLKRKWFTFAGNIEAAAGNVERALAYKLIALELCEEMSDSLGFCVEWSNFANFAMGAGLYQDAARYATIAIEAEGEYERAWLDLRGMSLINRGNALMRLGRFAEASSDFSLSLTSIDHPPSAAVRNRIVLAQYLFAETQLACGNRSVARAALHAASTWAEACGVAQYRLQVERVQARLSAFDNGVEHALATLRKLLEQGRELEAQLGESCLEDIVLDVLHTLEQVHREYGDLDGAAKWLKEIGEKLHANASRMLDALADKPLLTDGTALASKRAEFDRYLQSKPTALTRAFGTNSQWTHLVGLAARATSIEDPTKEHGVRVARLASLVARELGLSDALREGIAAGCVIHDVGKVSVPTSILLKTTLLDVNELYLYDAHPDVGAELVERLKHPEQSIVRNIVRFHHHPYIGETSQSMPVGEGIPLEARIASICDEYDSLVTGRPRRAAISSNDALLKIFEHRAGKFDPKIVDVFVDVVRRLQRAHPDLQAYLSEEADNMEYFAMQRTLKRAAERALTTE